MIMRQRSKSRSPLSIDGGGKNLATRVFGETNEMPLRKAIRNKEEMLKDNSWVFLTLCHKLYL